MRARPLLALAPTGPRRTEGFVVTPAARALARAALDAKTPAGGRWLPAFVALDGGPRLILQVWPRHRDYPGATLHFAEVTLQVLIWRNGLPMDGGTIDIDPDAPHTARWRA